MARSSIVLVCLLAGCSIADPAPLDSDPEFVKFAARAKKRRDLPRLALAPVQSVYSSEYDLKKEFGRRPAIYDRFAFTDALAADLASFTGFQAVARVDDLGLESKSPEKEAPALRAAFRAAAAADAKVLLVPKMTKFDIFFDRRNGYWIWNAMLWLYFWVPSFWVRDEDFGAKARLELTAYSVASERPIHTAVVDADVRKGLDDFDRGWDFLGIWRFPGSIDEDQILKVNDLIHPHALRALEKEFCVAVGSGLPDALEERDGDFARDATVHAVLCGVAKYGRPELIDGPDGAENDLLDLRAALAERHGVPEKNFAVARGFDDRPRPLLDSRATRANILGALDALKGRVRPNDTILFYFSGCGSAAGGEPYVLPYDADGRDLRTSAVSLRELADRLRALRPARAVVVLDAAFGPAPSGAGGARSYRGPGAPDAAPPAAAFEAATRGPVPIVLLLASGGASPGAEREGALDLVEAKRGLFTAILVEGIRSRADKDLDGEVSVRELATYVAPHVRTQAGVDGVVQEPALYAGGARVPLDRAPAVGAWLPMFR